VAAETWDVGLMTPVEGSIVYSSTWLSLASEEYKNLGGGKVLPVTVM
jgi:hypothetical protein